MTQQSESQAMAHEATLFVMQMAGDSMINAGILDGDKVVVRPQQTADNGEIVVALLDDSATVKRFRKVGATVWLMPQPPQRIIPCPA